MEKNRQNQLFIPIAALIDDFYKDTDDHLLNAHKANLNPENISRVNFELTIVIKYARAKKISDEKFYVSKKN